MPRKSRLFLTAALVACLPFAAHAQEAPASPAEAPAASGEYVPDVGQAGKDVVWVPTPQVLVDRMLEMAKATPEDTLVDLGSGDGVTVIAAARRGITARGIEFNPDMVALARRNAEKAGVSDKATFVEGDIFKTDFSDADILTLFLLPSLNEKLKPTILDMEPGTRVVTNTFTMGDWEPDDRATVEGDCKSWCSALLWIVPAKVDGSWQLGDQELTINQTYQKFDGTLGSQKIEEGRLNGREISFRAGDTTYSGTVEGDAISGKAEGGSATEWTAKKQ